MGTAPSERRWLKRPAATGPELGFGADYNPEQWPREVWDEDVTLMREAGVTVVSVGIFSWARLQPAPDRWDFQWLDEIMDLLHENGIGVDLATGTASPPPWLTSKHPEILPVTRTGDTLWPGGRQHWRPTSRVFREHALELVRAMARRYGSHPALVAWHVSNELGCHNALDYSDDAARAFREWLRERYGSIDALNHAWGTSFWSQHYTDWSQILPPRLSAYESNPTQQLDFKRFSSDALKDHLRAERAVLRRISPGIPVTTNFMVMDETRDMDYADWASEVDFISNDHYVRPGPQSRDELSFSANLTSNLAGGQPWFLMEHSTSAVNWQPINLAKRAGEMHRDALTHVAHGADAVCFFQWRQSSAGTEKYHSAMVPHAGRDSDVFRDVVSLGQALTALGPVAGSRRLPAKAAILFDWESWWVSEQDSHPSSLLRYRREALDWYSAFLDCGVRADVLPSRADLAGYEIVVAPILHVMPRELADRLHAFVAAGGHLVTTYFSAIVDEHAHVWLGGYPGPLRDLLGIRVEEFAPLLEDERVGLSDGTEGTLWAERLTVTEEVEVLARYASGELVGRPAITRRRAGAGSASYVSTRLGAAGLGRLVERVLRGANVESDLVPGGHGAVEVVLRRAGSDVFAFLINRTDLPLEVPGVAGDVLLGTRPIADTIRLGPREVAVLALAGSADSAERDIPEGRVRLPEVV